MRITVRMVLALVFAATLVVSLSTFLQVRQESSRLLEDLERRSSILAETLLETVEPALARKDSGQIARLVQKFDRRERLIGIAVCDENGRPLASTSRLDADLPSLSPLVREAVQSGSSLSRLKTVGIMERHVYLLPFRFNGDESGALLLLHDASFIRAGRKEIWRHNFFRLLLHAFLISLVTLWIVRWNITAPIAQMAEWMRQARSGESPPAPPSFSGLLEPLASEAKRMAKSLTAARASAEEEARLRQQAESIWTAERLREHVRVKLEGRPLFVVANREPYMHVRKGKRIEAITPASGMVTGIEPILRACGGVWIAHGAGEADREMVDEQNKVRVPPDEPQYTLKRVWLSKEEEQGYYYGFSNEGLWPLCHIAHTRPVFKEEDWKFYQAVNEKFASSLLEELQGVEEPFVLIQDYHFALLPRLIKRARPDARVAIFWHIPWPNPEAFAICPWQREILDGMLGADIIGFHIQFHCNNFLETVDRTLECRIDWERFAVQRLGHSTLVKPFPISIAFPSPASEEPFSREALLKELGIKARHIGVGVDRVDYTKGILERFRAIESFLEKYPAYRGDFVFLELGAPSRTLIKRYHELLTEVEAEAERINWRFQTKEYKPILLLRKHHSHREIEPFYKAADLCMVTSLHDGMNLVAKEFVASREDEKGVLILSRFTGAARELRESLIVNPYDTGQMADAIRYALEMDPEEQSKRMASMRRMLREQNIYFWAARLIEDLSKVALSPSAPSGVRS